MFYQSKIPELLQSKITTVQRTSLSLQTRLQFFLTPLFSLNISHYLIIIATNHSCFVCRSEKQTCKRGLMIKRIIYIIGIIIVMFSPSLRSCSLAFDQCGEKKPQLEIVFFWFFFRQAAPVFLLPFYITRFKQSNYKQCIVFYRTGIMDICEVAKTGMKPNVSSIFSSLLE